MTKYFGDEPLEFFVPIDFHDGELRNYRVQILAADPDPAQAIYLNSNGRIRVSDGTLWYNVDEFPGGTPGAHADSHEPGGSDPLDVDAAAGVGSLRTLGAGALQAAAGNDARLSDQRVPTDGSVTNAKVAVGAAIDLAKLAVNPLARANHTGTQTASTISDFQAEVDTRVQLIVDAAPAALDTLNELAAALGDDPNFAATINASLGDLDTRLDAIEAYGYKGKRIFVIGDGAASTFVLPHNLDTRSVGVVVREMAGNRPEVIVSNDATDLNNVTVKFGTHVPAVNSHEVTILA